MQQTSSPFTVEGMPAELAELINVHRSLFGGFTMTAGPAEGGTDDGSDLGGDQGAPQGGADGEAGKSAEETDAQKIARLEAEVAAARQDAGRSRVNAKQQAAQEARDQLVQELGKALGLVKDADKPATAAELQAQIADMGSKTGILETQVAQLQTQQVALLAAVREGLNPVALLDSNSFLRSIEGLAPNESEKITAALKAAVEANPSLAAQVVGKSGTDMAGGTGEGAITQEQFNNMDGTARNNLFRTNPTLYGQLAANQ